MCAYLRHVKCDNLKDYLNTFAETEHVTFETEVISATLTAKRYHKIELKRTRDPVLSEPSILIHEEDISARIKAESENKAKTDFVSALSHEIRTPINGILGFAEELSQSQLNSNQKQNCHYIIQSAILLSSMINNVFAMSRIGAGKQKDLVIAPFVVSTLLDEAVMLMKTVKSVDTVQISADYPANLKDKSFFGDEMVLRQVVVNLIGNAIKYTPKGNIKAGVTLLDMNATHGTLKFYVQGMLY